MINFDNQALYTTNGNRCGHDPKKFRVFDKEHPINCINKISLEIKKLTSLPKRLNKIFRHQTKINRVSQENKVTRSELKESCLLVADIYIHNYDIQTGLVYENLSHKQVAKMAGISPGRVKAAISFFKEMGWMTITELKVKTKDGEYKSGKAIKKISPKFFLDLVGEFFFKSIIYTREKIRKNIKLKSGRKLFPVIYSTRNREEDNQTVYHKKVANTTKEKSASDKKSEIDQAFYRYEQNPAKSLSDHLRDIIQEKQTA